MASGKVSQRVIGQGSHNVWKSQGQSGKAVILASVDTASAPLVTFKLKHQGLVKKFEFNMQQFQHQTFNITNPLPPPPNNMPQLVHIQHKAHLDLLWCKTTLLIYFIWQRLGRSRVLLASESCRVHCQSLVFSSPWLLLISR